VGTGNGLKISSPNQIKTETSRREDPQHTLHHPTIIEQFSIMKIFYLYLFILAIQCHLFSAEVAPEEEEEEEEEDNLGQMCVRGLGGFRGPRRFGGHVHTSCSLLCWILFCRGCRRKLCILVAIYYAIDCLG
jgi:hypothetical protein